MDGAERVWHLIRAEVQFREILLAFYRYDSEPSLWAGVERASEILHRSEVPKLFHFYAYKTQGNFISVIALPVYNPRVMREITEHVSGEKIMNVDDELSQKFHFYYREYLKVRQKGIVIQNVGDFEVKCCLN